MPEISCASLLVRDYAEAIRFFVGRVGFELVEDRDLGDGKRWVRVKPPGATGASLVLAKAVGADQQALVGRQAGGRVAFFLETSDFDREYERMRSAGVRFCEEPRNEEYGKVAVWLDLCGNRWDLVQSKRRVVIE